MATVKPLDEAALEAAAIETGAIVVAEEHLAHGGLGSVVAMGVARLHLCPVGFVNVGDTFAESGPGDELMEKYGLTASDVVRRPSRSSPGSARAESVPSGRTCTSSAEPSSAIRGQRLS